MQIVQKRQGVRTVLEHLGSAHTPEQLAALMAVGKAKLADPWQLALEFDVEDKPRAAGAVVKSSRSGVMIDTIRAVYDRLGFDAVDDEAFFQLVLARLVEPTSKSDSVRVLDELGVEVVHRNTFLACLARAKERDYRSTIAAKCFEHSVTTTGISLLLYDVTTLYFEAEDEDDLRKVGYSKERRVDPQIVVGLLVDRSGFPLKIACFEGNKAETKTIIPILKQFQDRHGVADMVIAADAGMLSAGNLKVIDEAGLRFFVGSRQSKALHDLATHFAFNGDHAADGTIVDTITPKGAKRLDPARVNVRREPVWNPEEHPDQWRTIWQYRRKRALRDARTLNLQRNRAIAIIDGNTPAKKARFVKVTDEEKAFDEKAYEQAMKLTGWKGYVTNIEAAIMPASEVIASYHDLWHVEQSFRMSKTDLRARPMFHRTKDAIEAHLSVVFTALAVARYIQEATGLSLKKIITQLRPLREFTGTINGHDITFTPEIPAETADILHALRNLGH